MMENDQIYCSKVNPGETLHEVIQREIPTLTGSNRFQLIDIKEGGTAPDRHGKELLRMDLFITVPYFEPKLEKLRHNLEWKVI